MSGFKRYDEDFKQSLVNLYQTGKTQTELCKDLVLLNCSDTSQFDALFWCIIRFSVTF